MRLCVMASERRTRLRLETAHLHRLLDDQMEALGSFAGFEGYNAYLLAAHTAWSHVEARLEASGVADIYPKWSDRRIARSIADDLADLGNSFPVHTSPRIFAPMSEGAMLGALYVLEGSALGARVIAPRLLLLGVGPSFGARHLSRQSSDSRAWPTFLRLLEETSLTEEEEKTCCREACATFDIFLRQSALAV